MTQSELRQPLPDAAAHPVTGARPERFGRVRAGLKGLVGIGLAVGVWELLRAAAVLPPSEAPSFATIVPTLGRQTWSGGLASAFVQSLKAWAAGMGVSLAIGIPVGALVGLSRWADALTGFVFDFLRPVPAVAFVPVAVVFFGTELKMQLFLIAVGAVWPLVFNTRFGVRAVDPLHLESARAMGVGRLRRLLRITLPSALPSVFTGVRTAASIAVVLTIVTEIVASGTGVGGYISKAQQYGLPDRAFAGVIVASVFGYVVYLGTELLESRVTRWHRELSRTTA